MTINNGKHQARARPGTENRVAARDFQAVKQHDAQRFRLPRFSIPNGCANRVILVPHHTLMPRGRTRAASPVIAFGREQSSVSLRLERGVAPWRSYTGLSFAIVRK
jgi:hypothetical protein